MNILSPPSHAPHSPIQLPPSFGAVCCWVLSWNVPLRFHSSSDISMKHSSTSHIHPSFFLLLSPCILLPPVLLPSQFPRTRQARWRCCCYWISSRATFIAVRAVSSVATNCPMSSPLKVLALSVFFWRSSFAFFLLLVPLRLGFSRLLITLPPFLLFCSFFNFFFFLFLFCSSFFFFFFFFYSFFFFFFLFRLLLLLLPLSSSSSSSLKPRPLFVSHCAYLFSLSSRSLFLNQDFIAYSLVISCFFLLSLMFL
jgi:hypothetical protein